MSESLWGGPVGYDAADEVLVRTATGVGLHLPVCPHVVDCDTTVATAEDRLRLRVCQWSQAELAGVGRTYFDSLEDAMRVFGTYVGTHRLVRDALRFVEHDQIWIPNSQSYIALGRANHGVAWAGKTWVWIKGVGRIELPGYSEHHGGGARKIERYGETCPTCFEQRSLSGACGNCD